MSQDRLDKALFVKANLTLVGVSHLGSGLTPFSWTYLGLPERPRRSCSALLGGRKQVPDHLQRHTHILEP